MNRSANKLRVVVLGDSHEIVALGKLVTVNEAVHFGHGDLTVAFLPPDCDILEQAQKRLGIVPTSGFSIVTRGEVRYSNVSRRFAEAFCKSWNQLNGRGSAKVVRPVK